MSISQPWEWTPSSLNSNGIWYTTFYEEKTIKILSNAGSQENRIRMEKGKKTKNSFKVMAKGHGWFRELKDAMFQGIRAYPL